MYMKEKKLDKNSRCFYEGGITVIIVGSGLGYQSSNPE